jgi:hypothetical protein
MRSRLLVLAWLPILGAGCSFAFGGGPPQDHAMMPYFDCPSTYGLPVADGFFAASGVAGAVTTFLKSKEEYAAENDGANRNVAGAANVATAAIYAASAAYGIVQATRCERAKAALKARILGPSIPPERSGPPPAPLRPAPRPAPVTPAPAPPPPPPTMEPAAPAPPPG